VGIARLRALAQGVEHGVEKYTGDRIAIAHGWFAVYAEWQKCQVV
jgi:hypothetical protein